MEFKRELNYKYAQVTSVLYTNEAGEKVTGKFAFRKRDEKVQVLVTKEIPLPEFTEAAKPIMARINDFFKGLRSTTMETRIKVLNEYWQEEPEATMVLQGWKETLNNRERHALTQVTSWN